ncbi:5108_t:CDS:2 [Diversispora eburnea]|uniref:5108_t:CDS:1 n=1 Tax=Diversispora eburnea TaxID=1213867 RepID=A0A9N9G510_9GLOM|nr:5108_t:CDS:2 [Diversispora eburnea]
MSLSKKQSAINVSQHIEKWLLSDASLIVKHHDVKFPLLEKALLYWTNQAIAGDMILSDDILQEKGRDFANYFNIEENQINFSRGWVTRFKKRNSIRMYKLHGEADSAPLESLVDECLKLQELISKYNPEDDKSRITVLLATNSTGTHKLKPLVIGHTKNPRCFKNINVSNLPQFENNEPLNLTNITIHYLPPNTTSHIQPLDAGIIKSSRQNISIIIVDINKINVKEAIEYVARSWDDLLADNEIENNSPPDSEEEKEGLPLPLVTSKEALNALKVLIRYEEQLTDNDDYNKISSNYLYKRLSLYCMSGDVKKIKNKFHLSIYG